MQQSWARLRIACLMSFLLLLSPAKAITPQKGTNLWIGLDLGGISSTPNDDTIETEKVGALGGGKIFLSRFLRHWLFEGGIGWQISRLRNENPIPAPSQEALILGNVDRQIVETKGGVGELAIRYRSEGFEIGPAAQVLFGTDTTYSPFSSLIEKPNFLAGLGAYYTWYHKSYNQRIGLQFLSDLSIKERQVSSAIFQYYVSLPFLPKGPNSKNRKDRVLTKYREKRRYVIDAGFINFATGKSEIAEHDLFYLQELGEFLAENREKWSWIFISSHTDSRGGDKINIELSRNRAGAVSEALQLPEELSSKVQIDSRASQNPVEAENDEVALARNRRAEIAIISGIDATDLKRKINLIQRKHLKKEP